MNLSWGALHAGLQSVLDTALDAVIVMDRDGRVAGWNARATGIFGWTASEAVGQRLSDLIIPKHLRGAHEAGLSHFLATGEAPVLDRHIEVEGLHRDGSLLPIELSITESDQFGGPLFIGFLRDITERKAATERQKRLLLESEHRVKNMLTVVAAIAQQTARTAPDVPSFSAAFAGRLDSLARAHQLLAGRTAEDISLTTIAEQVLGANVAEGRASYSGTDISLAAHQVLGLSMILHELYTNAVKYGALCTATGSVELSWDIADGEVQLDWRESGQTCEGAGSSSGFGQRMIDMSVKADLRGSIEREWGPDGLAVAIRFPVGG